MDALSAANSSTVVGRLIGQDGGREILEAGEVVMVEYGVDDFGCW